MTTIATWNLHHMGGPRRIPDGVTAVLAQVKPDVLVLTEYVDRGKRTDFRAALRGIHYQEPVVSPQGKGQNQVLIASKVKMVAGELSAPDVDDEEAPHTNFLHQRLPRLGLDVVGFRVPHYQSEKPVKPEKLVKYWRQFTNVALGMASQKVVFIGDFNVGDGKFDGPGQAALRKLVKAGYRMCGEVSGLDRALVSGSLTLQSFSVIEAAAGYRLAGKGGLSDHSMLVVDVA